MEYKQLKGLIWIIALISVIPQISALINNTLIYSEGLNSTIIIGTQGWELDGLSVNESFIYIENLTSSNPLETSNEPITFNFTVPNAVYLGMQFPYWSSSSKYRKKLYSGISENMTGAVYLDVESCTLSDLLYKPALGDWKEINYSLLNCNNSVLEMPLSIISYGINEIRLLYTDVILTDCSNSTTYAMLFGVYDEDNLTEIDFSRIKGTIYYWNSMNYDLNKSIGQRNLSFDKTIITSPVYTNEKDTIDLWSPSAGRKTGGATEIETKFTVKKDSIISHVYNKGLQSSCNEVNVSIYLGNCTTGTKILEKESSTVSTYFYEANFTLADYNNTPLKPINEYCLKQRQEGSCAPRKTSIDQSGSGTILGFQNTDIGDYNYFLVQAMGYIESGASICISPEDANITADAIIQYKGGEQGFTDWWYLYNQTLTNNTVTSYMYNFNETSKASDLDITVRYNKDYTFYKDVYTNLYRFYPAENIWRNVQRDRTDEFGKAIFHIKENSELYRIEFRDERYRLLKLTTGMKFICSGGLCQVTYLLNEYSPPEETDDFGIVTSYDNASKILSVNWSDSTGITYYVRTNVRKETMSGTTDICDETVYASTGGYTCNLSSYTGVVSVYVESNNNTVYSEWLDVTKGGLSTQLDRSEQVIFAFLILVTCFMLGLWSPVGAVFSLLFGIVALYLLGMLTPLTIMFVTIAGVLVIVAAMRLKQ